MALQGLWGSFFSRKGGRAMSQPQRIMPLRPIAVETGPALAPEEATPERLREIVQRLRGNRR
jgi:hypothetical protein